MGTDAGPNVMPFFSEWERLQEEPVREGNRDFYLAHEEFGIPVTTSETAGWSSFRRSCGRETKTGHVSMC